VLRQLARLTRPIPVAGRDALAVAVYADAADEHVIARESGFEGVACIDDAARALDVLCDVYVRTESPVIERWARGLLEFVLWMQEPDGRWINFVEDWSGKRNAVGITSAVGETFWHARALVGVSHAWLTFGDPRAEDAFHRGVDHSVSKPAPADVRVLHMISTMRTIADAGKRSLLTPLRHWAWEVAACREGDVLKNAADEPGTPHLWAHIQEGVLADAGAFLGERELVEIAEASAEALLLPAVAERFDRPGITPYDVACVVYSLDRLGVVTHKTRWAAQAELARAWFDGRNAAGLPVYDRERGRVADGIDEERVSDNSGAEANIVGAEALFAHAVESVRLHEERLAALLPARV
jgi:hypothetical protein